MMSLLWSWMLCVYFVVDGLAFVDDVVGGVTIVVTSVCSGWLLILCVVRGLLCIVVIV